MRVGIPKALLYHEHGPQWERFLAGLGVETVTSAPTNRETLDAGVRAAVDEACLPVKVYLGHCMMLLREVKTLFIPRVVSTAAGAYHCPKLIGLPDVVRACCPGAQVIAPTVNVSRGFAGVTRAALATGAAFGRKPLATWRAWTVAVQATGQPRPALPPGNGLTLGLLGHSYMRHDRQVSLDVAAKLQGLGVRLVEAGMLSPACIAGGASRQGKPTFWVLEREVIGAGYHLIHGGEPRVDGLVHLTSFGCGPDSLVAEMVEREARRSRVPFLLLTFDEHTGEAGLTTRLEAFVDLVRWRKRRCE